MILWAFKINDFIFDEQLTEYVSVVKQNVFGVPVNVPEESCEAKQNEIRRLCAHLVIFVDELILALFSVFQLLNIPKCGIRSLLRLIR